VLDFTGFAGGFAWILCGSESGANYRKKPKFDAKSV